MLSPVDTSTEGLGMQHLVSVPISACSGGTRKQGKVLGPEAGKGGSWCMAYHQCSRLRFRVPASEKEGEERSWGTRSLHRDPAVGARQPCCVHWGRNTSSPLSKVLPVFVVSCSTGARTSSVT